MEDNLHIPGWYYRTSSMPVRGIILVTPHLRGTQFRPTGFIAFPLDEGLPPHRCYAAYRLPSGKGDDIIQLFCLQTAIRQGDNTMLPLCLPVAIRQGYDITSPHYLPDGSLQTAIRQDDIMQLHCLPVAIRYDNKIIFPKLKVQSENPVHVR